MMAYDPDNIFAAILRGDIPCEKLYEDSHVLAFYDIHPKAPVHILVIPKGPYTDIADFGARAGTEEIVHFWRAVSRLAHEHALDGTERGGGFRLVSNAGPEGGQEVPHFHVHILAGKRMGPVTG